VREWKAYAQEEDDQWTLVIPEKFKRYKYYVDAAKARVNLLGANRVPIGYSHSYHRRLQCSSIFDRIEWPESVRDCHRNLQKDHNLDHQKDSLHATFNDQARRQA
jgi:hypothetical protein